MGQCGGCPGAERGSVLWSVRGSAWPGCSDIAGPFQRRGEAVRRGRRKSGPSLRRKGWKEGRRSRAVGRGWRAVRVCACVRDRWTADLRWTDLSIFIGGSRQ